MMRYVFALLVVLSASAMATPVTTETTITITITTKPPNAEATTQVFKFTASAFKTVLSDLLTTLNGMPTTADTIVIKNLTIKLQELLVKLSNGDRSTATLTAFAQTFFDLITAISKTNDPVLMAYVTKLNNFVTTNPVTTTQAPVVVDQSTQIILDLKQLLVTLQTLNSGTMSLTVTAIIQAITDLDLSKPDAFDQLITLLQYAITLLSLSTNNPNAEATAKSIIGYVLQLIAYVSLKENSPTGALLTAFIVNLSQNGVITWNQAVNLLEGLKNGGRNNRAIQLQTLLAILRALSLKIPSVFTTDFNTLISQVDSARQGTNNINSIYATLVKLVETLKNYTGSDRAAWALYFTSIIEILISIYGPNTTASELLATLKALPNATTPACNTAQGLVPVLVQGVLCLVGGLLG